MGDLVFVKDFPQGKKWLTGTVSAVKGPLSYHITLTDGRIVRRHVDHVRIRTSTAVDDNPEDDVMDFPTPSTPEVAPHNAAGAAAPATTPPVVPLRCSTRHINPPDYYGH